MVLKSIPPSVRGAASRALLLVLAVLGAVSAHATHNRAGEIRVEQIGPLTVRATITTYTAFQGNSRDADRDTLTLEWGDGSFSRVLRINGPNGDVGVPNGEAIGDNIKQNVYVATHTYSAANRYVLGVQDPNRVDAIRNINNGGSVDVLFYIRTVYSFFNSGDTGINSTPALLQPPIDEGCVGEVFTHNPNAFDPDGDSLAYRLGIPLQGEGVPVVNYQLPSEFGGTGTAGTDPNVFTLDQTSGTITWNAPREQGDYNVVLQVISYRQGVAIDTTVRDMQISIRANCNNSPPEIEVENDFCLVAGQDIELTPVATAPIEEVNQEVTLTATSPPLSPDFFSPAEWNGDSAFHTQPWQRRYYWQTVCEHAARFPYRVIFRSLDRGSGGTELVRGLSRLEVVNIKVSAPPPGDLAIRAGDDLIDLSWGSPYECEDALDDFFFGFSVYRREGSNPFPFDSCQQGLEGRGYTRIAINQRTLEDGRYVFTDDDVERGRTYCYRVVANFSRITSTGNRFNRVESIPSDEICVQSSRDIPLLTRADVLETDAATGRVDVRWTPPLPEDLDTVANPAPYTYTLLRSPGVGTDAFAPVAGAQRTFNSYAALTRDTQFVDAGLDTRSRGYTYALDFRSEGDANPLPPLSSSTVFLTPTPANEAADLSWRAETSWENVRYAVLREDPSTGVFDTIARTTRTRYIDGGLDNGIEYCYQIVAFGTYGVGTIYSPLLNRSQEACVVPQDIDAPCPPVLTVQTVCDNLRDENLEPPYPTVLSYSFSGDCTPAPDLAFVRLYTVADSSLSGRTLVGELEWPLDTMLRLESDTQVAACYALTAVDTVGNESPLAGLTCVENCPFYEVPNVFTPNGDGQHDVLRPRISRFVASVEMTVVNRWGVTVFETEDPELGWDGTDLNGEDVSDGTFFYQCRVFQRRADGAVEEVGNAPLSGFIEVLRGA